MYKRLFLSFLMVLCFTAVACSADSLAQDAEHQGGGASDVFSGYWAEALWAVISFAVLLFALWKLAWKPLLAALLAREQHIQKQIDDAEKTRKDAQDILDQYNSKLAEAEKQGKIIIEQHLRQAEKDTRELTSKAQQDIEVMRLRLETDIERARRLAQKELLAKSGEVILQLGRQILGKSISTEDNQNLIDQAIERLEIEKDEDVRQ